MDDAALIPVVQHYEELYNLKHPQYSNVQRRQNIWEEIGIIMKQSADVCKQRWTRIRDNHRRALKLRKTKSGQAAIKTKAPKFEKELTFLTPYLIDDEQRVCNIPSPPAVMSEEENTENEELQIAEQEQNLTPSLNTFDIQNTMSTDSARSSRASTPLAASTVQRRKRSATNPGPISVASVVKEYIDSTQKVPSDPLTSFFLTMAATVLTFPLPEQIAIKRQIFDIINDAENRIAMESTATRNTTTNFYEQASSSLISNDQGHVFNPPSCSSYMINHLESNDDGGVNITDLS